LSRQKILIPDCQLFAGFQGVGSEKISIPCGRPQLIKIFTALAVAGQSEVREYQAFGVLNDQPIGQPGNIVSVTFAG
jgi:hypothetical protein